MKNRFKRVQNFKDLPDPARILELTPRQIEVLMLVAQNKTNIQIAEKLGVGEKTIENHRYNMGCKLELKGRNSLYYYSLKVFVFSKMRDI